ncbi:MAG: hypothetical protein IID44_04350 [Planctomycetes bacterium]|nr:hypothetical protein [Planctomycetota bacterium]
MATRSFLFGNPPFRFLAGHLAQDADFLNDARHILDIDQDAYLRLSTQLAKSDAFLSRSDLVSIVGEALGASEDSKRIASIIYRFGSILHDADMDATEAMDELGRAIEEKAESLDPQERRTLTDRLRKLAAEPIGIAKQYKARQLVDAIGAELDDFRIICDIRPIFDKQRERIEGAIPLTVLRLEYSKPDGESAVVEVRVTEKQIARFGEKMADAGLKLRMIKDLLVHHELPIPKTKSTNAEDES